MIQIEKKKREGKESLYYVQINDEISFGFTLTQKQLEELYLEICQHLFDNLLEQNKDLLMRLKNNVPAPKMLNSDKVIEWLRNRSTSLFGPRLCKTMNIIKHFEKDFEL